MNLASKMMTRKFISYFVAYLLLLISFMLFFSASGYYLFIFDWSKGALIVTVHGFLLFGLIALSIAIYAVAEKMKERS
ncbi:hypothetical protein AZ021_001417 [Enterobacter ludwigii]|nr:hypothetical protein ABR36_17660 [Enterobacter ludwigii]OUF16753.1 hypothetical protein AZ021_001417 [Enterobacter ludwigii]